MKEGGMKQKKGKVDEKTPPVKEELTIPKWITY